MEQALPVVEQYDVFGDELPDHHGKKCKWLQKADLKKHRIKRLSAVVEWIPQWVVAVQQRFCKKMKDRIIPVKVIVPEGAGPGKKRDAKKKKNETDDCGSPQPFDMPCEISSHHGCMVPEKAPI